MFVPFYSTYFVYLFSVVYGIPSINSSRYFIAPQLFAIQTLRWDTYQLLHYTIHSHYLAFMSRYILLYIAVCHTNTELSCLEYYNNNGHETLVDISQKYRNTSFQPAFVAETNHFWPHKRTTIIKGIIYNGFMAFPRQF